MQISELDVEQTLDHHVRRHMAWNALHVKKRSPSAFCVCHRTSHTTQAVLRFTEAQAALRAQGTGCTHTQQSRTALKTI